MTEVPDSLRSVFTASIDRSGSDYSVSIPAGEVRNAGVTPGETYRVAIFETTDGASSTARPTSPSRPIRHDEPPVAVDDIIDVEIESLGDEGDGIAKVDRGYVIIVPDGQPGETLTVRIDEVKENVAFAAIHH